MQFFINCIYFRPVGNAAKFSTICCALNMLSVANHCALVITWHIGDFVPWYFHLCSSEKNCSKTIQLLDIDSGNSYCLLIITINMTHTSLLKNSTNILSKIWVVGQRHLVHYRLFHLQKLLKDSNVCSYTWHPKNIKSAIPVISSTITVHNVDRKALISYHVLATLEHSYIRSPNWVQDWLSTTYLKSTLTQ